MKSKFQKMLDKIAISEEDAPMTQGEQAPATATAPAPAPTQDTSDNEEPWEWNIKQLIGILRYAGAMASGLRGGTPDEAMEVIKKVMKDMLEIGEELKQYATEAAPEETQEETPEEEAETTPEEEPTTFKREI